MISFRGIEEKVKEEGEHIIEELKDKIKNPVKVFHLSLEIMALIVDENIKSCSIY